MIKKATSSLLLAALFLMSGCDSTSGIQNSNLPGPSSLGSNTFGSLSEGTDIATVLEERTWTSISINLDRYFYETEGSQDEYTLEMDFSKGKVAVLADCYRISAQYKVKENMIEFSKVSSPKPAIDDRTCKPFIDADNAALAFFSSAYEVTSAGKKSLKFVSTDIEATVILK